MLLLIAALIAGTVFASFKKLGTIEAYASVSFE